MPRSKAVVPLHPAAPEFNRNDIVAYRDRQGRYQTGRVRAVEAQWRWGEDGDAHVTYELEHPTYRNNTFVTTALNIFGVTNNEASHDPA